MVHKKKTGQTKEELRLATRYNDCGDMSGSTKTLVSCSRGTDSLGSMTVNFQQ